jgi:hypothetical protein
MSFCRYSILVIVLSCLEIHSWLSCWYLQAVYFWWTSMINDSFCITNLNYSYNVSQPFLLKQWDLPINYKHTRSFGFVVRVTQRVPHVEQELLILPKHLSSPTVFRSVVFCVKFCRSLFVVFCLTLYWLSIYVFWLSILHLQSFRGKRKCLNTHINSQLLKAFATERFLQII